MKKLPIGLVIEGNSISSRLLRLPALADELGPIKSSGLHVARRVSNSLKVGYGVSSYQELAETRTILIRVADSSIDRVVGHLCQLDLVWEQHSFVLCESWAPTEKLEPLRQLGSATASLVALPTIHEKTYVIEGDTVVVRQMRRVIERADARCVELRQGTKHLLFAATALCNAIPVPLLLMAQQLLRDSGVTGNQLSAMLEDMSEEMLSCFLKGARMTWGGPLAEALKQTQGDYWDQLDLTHPEAATRLRDLLDVTRNTKMVRARGA